MKLSHRNLLFSLFSLFLLLLNAKTIHRLTQFSLDFDNTEASHILVIPFLSLALIWLNRENIFHDVRWSVMPAMVLVVLGSSLYIAGMTARTRLNQNDHLALLTLAVIVLWLSGFLLFYGSAAFRTALFPLLFLLLAIPIPSRFLERVVGMLQVGSAGVAYGLLRLAGTPVYREGMVFVLPDLVVEVAPECSGIRSGIALLISSLVAGHFFLRSTRRRAALLFAAIPVLLFKNGLRIAVLSLLAVHYDKRILTSQLHREGGIPFFVLGLFLIYPVLKMLVKSERHRSKATADARSLSAQYGGFQ